MRKLALTSLALLLLPAAAALAVTVTWNFTDGDATFDTGTPVNFAVSVLSAGNSTLAINNTSPSNYTGASGGNNAATSAVAGALSVANSTYYSFTLTPSGGFSINATNITFGSRSTASGPTTLSIRSSIDGFAANLASATSPIDSTWNLYNLNFNATGLTGAAVEFRIYGSGGTSTASNWRIDDLSVNATAIPEPATYMLMGLGVLMCAQQFRRTKK